MFTVVTSFSPAGYKTYGETFIASFYRHWAKDVQLIVYYEVERPPGIERGYDLQHLKPLAEFLIRHKDNLQVRGLEEHPNVPWGKAARGSKMPDGTPSEKGYQFRADAWRFCRKVFAVADAARKVKTGKLFWLDADIETFADVPTALLSGLLPDDTHICYLRRHNYPSECGFVGYNLNHNMTRIFINRYEDQYQHDLFLYDHGWDDCSQLDLLIARLNPRTKPILHSSQSHPFDHSILGNYMWHDKGLRKFNARSARMVSAFR